MVAVVTTVGTPVRKAFIWASIDQGRGIIELKTDMKNPLVAAVQAD